MKQQKKILGIVLFVIFGYIAYGVFSFVGRHFLGYIYPDGSFLFWPIDRFMDFFNVNQMVSERRPYVDYWSSYPPFILVIAWFFSLFADYGTYTPTEIAQMTEGRVSYAIYVVLFTVLIGIYLYKILLTKKTCFKNPVFLIFTVLCMIFTAPYIFIIDRGNYLLVSIVLFSAFVYYYDKNETLAAICIGLAAAVKIYPLFFLILYFVDKKWKPAGVMLLSGGLVSGLSLLFFDGGFVQNFKEFVCAVLNFGGGYANEAPNVYFGVGLTSLLRFPCFLWNDGVMPENIPVMLIYLILGTVLTLWSIWNLWHEECYWKKILVLSVLMVFLTPNSYMYNLMYLIPGVVLFMISDASEQKKHDIVYLIELGFILIPKAYYYVSYEDAVGIQVVFDSGLLLLFVLYYNSMDRSTRRQKRQNS
jgi:hypothetical protein